MRVGAYQFAVTEDIESNLNNVREGINKAIERDVHLLIFPECALTGYPPRDIKYSAAVDFEKLETVYDEIQKCVDDNSINVILGTISKEANKNYNSAFLFRPFKEKISYDKRALWGWDKENFYEGKHSGVVDLGEFKLGIRICFEIRFPEFFRELYRSQTDLNVVLFYDVSDFNDIERYELMKSHIRTRAVENVTHIMTVNTIHPYQTAPTMLCDKSGKIVCELERNRKGLLVYDLNKEELDFGEQGRKTISDSLVRGNEVYRNDICRYKQ